MGICKYWFIARNCCYAACHCVETPHQYSIHHRPPQVCTPYTDIGEDLMLSFELCAYPIHSSISHNLLFFVSIFSRLHYTNLLWTSWAIKVDLFFGTTDICVINYLSCFCILESICSEYFHLVYGHPKRRIHFSFCVRVWGNSSIMAGWKFLYFVWYCSLYDFLDWIYSETNLLSLLMKSQRMLIRVLVLVEILSFHYGCFPALPCWIFQFLLFEKLKKIKKLPVLVAIIAYEAKRKFI